jgi:3-phenylpropionate/trans-cinnamate dioxygenase subunit alpha
MYRGPGRQFSSTAGHGVGFFLQIVKGTGLDEVTKFYSDVEGETADRLGEFRAAFMKYTHNTVFPNFSFLAGPNTIRLWHPRGPGEVEVWAWTLVPAKADERLKQAWRQSTDRTFSSAGMFEQDDGENWSHMQRVLRGHMARHTRLNVLMGLGHAISDERMPGEGRITEHGLGEGPARRMYERWAELMNGTPWNELDFDPPLDQERFAPRSTI